MINEFDIDKASRDELRGIRTEDMAEFLRKKFAPELRCAMCASTDMHVIGSPEQLYVFAMPTFLTDMPADPRKFLVSIVECGNCGYTHLFSPTPLQDAMDAKVKDVEGNV
ncbi:hypothetical protein NBH81_20445 [Aeromonas veronii]|uniref:hypothetical protein n=1 Tax=Aeromonas veronii TaxID=654 RepID=UPI0021D8509B|nr:hypothetical protein [Aeromonas veronii]UYB70655.1 hypothetical protein NBH81_20445 [Aeromonas veronii]